MLSISSVMLKYIGNGIPAIPIPGRSGEYKLYYIETVNGVYVELIEYVTGITSA